MERHISGQVNAERIAFTRAIRSFVFKQIERWIEARLESRAAGNEDEEGPSYLVTLLGAELRSGICCHVEVRMNRQVWIGTSYAEGVTQAVLQCLRHMSPAQLYPVRA